MTDKPAVLRTAIEDWKNQLISSERLFEIWQVRFHTTYLALFAESRVGGKGLIDIPTERIEEILEAAKD